MIEQASKQDGTGAISVRGLTRRFGTNVAVQPFQLDVGPGGVTGLLGPNGSGKSTLLRMLIGLVPPSGGGATVDGVPLAGDGTAIRRRVTYMPGEISVYGELSGEAHLRWLTADRGRDATERAIALGHELELPLERQVRGYSHGMKRQLFLAAALAPEVRVRILDEPSEGLDPTKRAAVLSLLEREAARGTTVLLSSHHLGEVDRTCTRTLFLRRGELLDETAATSLRERARRTVRVTWSDAPTARATLPALEALGVEGLRLEEQRTHFLLPAGDAREHLARFLGSGVPEPEALIFGELSLSELYRELYGKEGV